MRYRITIMSEAGAFSGDGSYIMSNVFEQVLEDIDIRQVAIAINEAAMASERDALVKIGQIEFPKLTKTNQPR